MNESKLLMPTFMKKLTFMTCVDKFPRFLVDISIFYDVISWFRHKTALFLLSITWYASNEYDLARKVGRVNTRYWHIFGTPKICASKVAMSIMR